MRISSVACYHSVVCNRFARIFQRYSHFLPVCRMPAYRRIYRSAVLLYVSAYNSLILPCKAVLLYLLRKQSVRKVILSNYQQTARVLIYTVYYSRTEYPVYSRKRISAVIQQGIYKSTVGISRRRMYYHSSRLIHNKKVAVLINYIKRYIFRQSFRRYGFGYSQYYPVALSELHVLLRHFTVDCDHFIIYQLLHCRTCKLTVKLRKILVYPHSRILFACFIFPVFHSGSVLVLIFIHGSLFFELV